MNDWYIIWRKDGSAAWVPMGRERGREAAVRQMDMLALEARKAVWPKRLWDVQWEVREMSLGAPSNEG